MEVVTNNLGTMAHWDTLRVTTDHGQGSTVWLLQETKLVRESQARWNHRLAKDSLKAAWSGPVQQRGGRLSYGGVAVLTPKPYHAVQLSELDGLQELSREGYVAAASFPVAGGAGVSQSRT